MEIIPFAVGIGNYLQYTDSLRVTDRHPRCGVSVSVMTLFPKTSIRPKTI